ncbi:MAG: thymidylate synthase [Candidatus Woesearchaeota archaeon]
MIIAKTANQAWKEILKLILDKGIDFNDENKRTCREVFNILIRLEEPEKEITRPIKILNDFKNWKYPSIEDIKQVMLSNKGTPDYSYSYGPRMFNFQNKIDQINDFIIPLLKESPSSRRATIIVWDPVQDSNVFKRDIPGLVMIDFKLRKERLNMTAVIRSNDVFFGWPANIYQLFELQNFISRKIGCKIGTLDTFSISAHIFEDQFEFIKKVLDIKD